MACQLPADCLYEIFEYLEESETSLFGCLLVNRSWCVVAVRILWRNIWRFLKYFTIQNQFKNETIILNTLISCLPNESKELLQKIIPTFTSKTPMFNYAGFCRVLSIQDIGRIIDNVLEPSIDSIGSSINSLSIKYRNNLIAREIIKNFLRQISSLRRLNYCVDNYSILNNISFIGTNNCLTNLTELHCSSSIKSDLSQICHNLQSLSIKFKENVSNDLKDLISLQKNLKNLKLFFYGTNDWKDIIPTLTKSTNTLTTLHIYSYYCKDLSLSFIASFLNLQEIILGFEGINLEDFKELQNIFFPKLQILRIPYQCFKLEYLINFLKKNGKNLKELHIDGGNKNLNLYIAKFCPNLKKLSIILSNKLILKTIFMSCQYLESIKIWWVGRKSEMKIFKTILKHSPKNFCELKIFNNSQSKLSPKDLKYFFIDWKDRIPFTLIVIKGYYNSLEANRKNMKIIKKYKKLGVIKNFEIKEFYEEEIDIF
ncbi:unnamed protein product [Rhizophagus irregularis]|nr:unnamed protein product [Rhizophagus irregularis]